MDEYIIADSLPKCAVITFNLTRKDLHPIRVDEGGITVLEMRQNIRLRKLILSLP
jgi:hypothetical protein